MNNYTYFTLDLGLYYFSHEFTDVDCTMGSAIMLRNSIMATKRRISPVGHVTNLGSLSTSALDLCRTGEQVEYRIDL